jgi:hypothetical protein
MERKTSGCLTILLSVIVLGISMYVSYLALQSVGVL